MSAAEVEDRPQPNFEPPSLGRRIWVVGSSGSGKSTLGKALSSALVLPYVELDALYHGPNWGEPTPEEFLARVDATLGAEWVCDGNYSACRPRMLLESETIIWLDLSFPVVFGSVVRRTFRRCWRKEVLWNGNRERLWPQFFARDSLLWWVIKTYRSHRRRFAEIFGREDVAPKLIRFRRREEVISFIQYLVSSSQ